MLRRIDDPNGPYCICEDGFYGNGIDEECQACPIGCLTCSSDSVCLTCASSRELQNSLCVCKSGFYEDANNTQEECS